MNVHESVDVAPMKVARVTPYLSDRYLFVEVETEDGLVGVGECGAWGQLEAARTAVEKFGDYLVGEDAGTIELHWNRMQRFGWFRGAVVGAAISGIDIALWDIKGQALGQPVYALLGGPARTRARAYCHVKASSQAQMVENCLRRKEQGFTAIGHLNPFLDEDRTIAYGKSHARKIGDAVAVIADLRDRLGNDVDLCVEIHRRLTSAEAITFAREIAPYRPMFYEDPIAPTSADAMGRVADKVDIPIATGERFSTLNDFQMHLSRGALSYARISVCLCGGITGARKIAALCEAFDVGVIPHNPLSPVSLAACLQLDAAIPNFVIQEFPTVGLEFESAEEDGDAAGQWLRGEQLVDEIPEVREGYVDIPTRPGIGIALSKRGRAAPAIARGVRMRAHKDGFVVDQ
ncbi:MAG: galactokinase [Roseitalea sp.]|jgi:galactonate dehydratase|nr:galactokinase [Roseitalea sp.]MBO6720371.1 galactokinase [Roseitalea sp.]MBO6742731.1 galactokinase [Roseitalea sp.]